MEVLLGLTKTQSRNNLRWARILVRFKEDMPPCVSIGIWRKFFSVPIWVESTTFCRHWISHGGTAGVRKLAKNHREKEVSDFHARDSYAREGRPSNGPKVSHKYERTWEARDDLNSNFKKQRYNSVISSF